MADNERDNVQVLAMAFVNAGKASGANPHEVLMAACVAAAAVMKSQMVMVPPPGLTPEEQREDRRAYFMDVAAAAFDATGVIRRDGVPAGDGPVMTAQTDIERERMRRDIRDGKA